MKIAAYYYIYSQGYGAGGCTTTIFWWKGTRIAGGIRKIDIYLAFDVWFDFSAMICVAFRAYSFTSLMTIL